MKQTIITRLLAVLGAITVIFSFVGCSQPEDHNSGPEESGTSAVSDSGDPLAGQWQSEKLSNYIYTFNGDGTGQYDTAGTILKLNYATDNGKITITFLAEGFSPVTLDYVLEGDRLNIKDSFGNDTYYRKIVNGESSTEN